MNKRRGKFNDLIKWQAILHDDYLCDKFSCVTYLKAEVNDNKKLSFLVDRLHNLYPLKDKKFKRVRKIDFKNNENISSTKFEIILSTKETIKDNPLPSSIYQNLSNISEIELPNNKILTKKQYEIVIKNYWPVSFHLDKYIESLIDNSYNENFEQSSKLNFFARLTLNLARFNNCNSASLVVDQRKNIIVASGIDNRKIHPLKHPVIVAIDNVSNRQKNNYTILNSDETIYCNKNESNFIDFLKISHQNGEISSTEFHFLNENLNNKLDVNDHLCRNYSIFLVNEPCGLCSMALIHSRIEKVYFIFNTNYGFLNSKAKLHCFSNLNHHFEAFKAIDFDLNPGMQSNFNKEKRFKIE